MVPKKCPLKVKIGINGGIIAAAMTALIFTLEIEILSDWAYRVGVYFVDLPEELHKKITSI